MNIYFDMDGTLADFYSVDGWLEKILQENVSPYADAAPIVDQQLLQNLQLAGHRLSVISWAAKGSSFKFAAATARTKREWLARHYPAIHWDQIYIVPYGKPKQLYRFHTTDILIDDDAAVRKAWGTASYSSMVEFSLR